MANIVTKGCHVVDGLLLCWYQDIIVSQSIFSNALRLGQFALLNGIIPEVIRKIAHHSSVRDLLTEYMGHKELKHFPSGSALFAASRLTQQLFIYYYLKKGYNSYGNQIIAQKISFCLNVFLIGLALYQRKSSETWKGASIRVLSGTALGILHGCTMNYLALNSYYIDRFIKK